MDRALESSRFPLLAGQDHRQLLSKRVTTVHNFRHEISARRYNGTSEMQPSNGIPVPLHRGETLQQYTQKFERWLAQRAQSLVKLRNDPSRERNFWFSFAYQRAEQIPERKRSIPNNAGNSCYDAEVKRVRFEEVLHVNTSGSAMATEELSSNFSLSTGVSSQEPLRGQPDYSGLGLSGGQPAPILPQRSRKEVLAQRTLTPEEFLREVLERRQNRTSYEPISKLREIPVPLYPGETVQDYEKEFRCWAYKHHETIKSQCAQPMKERGFRCQFELDKVTARSARMEPRSRTENGTLSGMDRSHAHGTSDAKILSSLHDPPLQPTTHCEAAAVNQYHFSQSGYDMES